MFRVETQLEMLAATRSGGGGRPAIRLRGDQIEEPMRAAAQFQDTPAVSVGDVVGHCPNHRDLFFRKRQGIRVAGERPENQTWPRVAGRVIEAAVRHAYEKRRSTASAKPWSGSVDAIAKAASAHVVEYSELAKRKFAELERKASGGPYLPNNELQRLLVDTVTLDLFHLQGALSYERYPARGADRALRAVRPFPEVMPAAHLKLGKATPDFYGVKRRLPSGFLHDDRGVATRGTSAGR